MNYEFEITKMNNKLVTFARQSCLVTLYLSELFKVSSWLKNYYRIFREIVSSNFKMKKLKIKVRRFE